MAVLAFLMTAIGSLMGSSVASQRKQKAEIQVHTSAQETYNQISDTIMQAKEVVIVGYEVKDASYNFVVPGDTVTETAQLVYYVKDEEMKEFIKKFPAVYGTEGADSIGDENIKLFSQYNPKNSLYVKKLAIMTSVPLDYSAVPSEQRRGSGTDGDGNEYIVLADALADTSDNQVTIGLTKTASGLDAYTKYDNVVHIYTFEGTDMYYERHYSFMTTLNDMIDTSVSGSKESCLYNEGFSYVVSSDSTIGEITGCKATIDANGGKIGIDLMFNNRNMTYTTEGMINIRNSYVLKGKDN